MKYAVIMCSFNRKEYTRRCITILLESMKRYRNEGAIYVCDDASTDGTPEMIRHQFPQVKILESSGNLYWCKSMYCAMKKAVKEEYDYYLMVNDDVDFNVDVIKIMFQSYQIANELCGVVGSTHSDGKCTYGGRNSEEILLVPNGKLQRCVWANWNCFLISRAVIERVGIIDSKYEHAFGDFDYSFRMNKNNIPIYVATDYIGKCEKNSLVGTYKDKTVSRMRRLQLLFSAKGMPVYSYFRYNIRTGGLKQIFKFICGYLSIIVYTLCNDKEK